MVLELCQQGDLDNYLKTMKQLELSKAVSYFKQIVEGVHYLHSRGVIHRDLKLGNILFGQDGNIKIADFGLAAQLSEEDEQRDTQCGTPTTVAPEVLRNAGYGLEADIWSLGCILYSLVVGRQPFKGKSI